MERQMDRVTLCDIEDTAHLLEENKNVEIERQSSKQSFIFGNDDDKWVSNTANEMFDAE